MPKPLPSLHDRDWRRLRTRCQRPHYYRGAPRRRLWRSGPVFYSAESITLADGSGKAGATVYAAMTAEDAEYWRTILRQELR